MESLSVIIKTTTEVYNGKCLETCIHANILAENQNPESSVTGESTTQSPVPGDFLTWPISTTTIYWVLSSVIIAALTVLYIKFGPSHGKDMYHIPLSTDQTCIITTCMTQV